MYGAAQVGPNPSILKGTRFPLTLLPKLEIRPTLAEASDAFKKTENSPYRPTLLPVCASTPADLLTPSAIYLKLSSGYFIIAMTILETTSDLFYPEPRPTTHFFSRARLEAQKQ